MSLYGREALEDAARGWVSEATGIPLARCYWSGDAGPRPEGLALSASLTLTPRPGRGGFASISYHPLPLPYPTRGYTLAAGAVQVPGHGLTSGDGPLVLTGAVSGSYWVISLGPDALVLAADFFRARAGEPIALPAAGSGTIAADSSTVAYAAPATRVRGSVATLELRVEVRGGTPTGSTSPLHVLDTLREAVDDAECPLAVVKVGAVQGLPGGVTGGVRLEPYGLWTAEVEVAALASRPVGVVERVVVDLGEVV